MGALGSWVLRQACHQLRALTSAGMTDATMSVNVSVTQLHDPRFAQRCLDVLHDAGIAPRRLELEVTETVLLQDRESVLAQLTELRAHGVGIAIDDFGTGYSSLSYLRHLPIDKIKIDQSFVRDMLRERDASSIVQVIVALAHTLRHRVVAEGVETLAQREALLDLDCDQAQGFLFARPMPAAALFDWLDARRDIGRSQRPAAAANDLSHHR
jgi:EAL domain-containing protein (putative c-di-GMP-specific phosphodiesterase class I)